MTRESSNAADGCRDFLRAQSLTRRGLLQLGGLSLLGDNLFGKALAATPEATPVRGTFGRAKRCIFLFMWGGPSQLETFDPKPDAPSDIRGEFQPISTNVPGLHISEHFRHMAAQMDKVCVVRSLCHDDPAHLSSGHATLTGHLAPVVRSDAEPPSDRDSPHLGSVVARLKPGARTMPAFVTLPWLCHHPAAPGGNAPGQNGGWYGKRYSPLMVTGDPNLPDWNIPSLNLIDGIDARRLDDRRALLGSIDRLRAGIDVDGTIPEVNSLRDQAFGLLGSPQVRNAFDLNRESAATRERYGRNIHGQCVLLARRLAEQGVPVVSVNWHNDGRNFWDTHDNNFNRLKNDLIPPADQALAALLTDLSERGMLDDTLVCWVGEFGRKPQISGTAGRDHWPGCYSGLFAGAGIHGGSVYGASDKFAAAPRENPVSPQDYAATVLHALGVDPQTMVPDKLGRPIAVNEGRVIHGVFG
jgi:hypothetical protein